MGSQDQGRRRGRVLQSLTSNRDQTLAAHPTHAARIEQSNSSFASKRPFCFLSSPSSIPHALAVPLCDHSLVTRSNHILLSRLWPAPRFQSFQPTKLSTFTTTTLRTYCNDSPRQDLRRKHSLRDSTSLPTVSHTVYPFSSTYRRYHLFAQDSTPVTAHKKADRH
jgi:hypothetical protein